MGEKRCWFRKERRNFGSPGRTTDARQGSASAEWQQFRLEGRWERPITSKGTAIALGAPQKAPG
ncbi:hypothetical protein APTSU1_001247300 [Apodemus speciosus]|uniref:Uncharacterized protein n=1 Tax=Apodemus speciosus TaxID=105296 RepID=A0ABQ0FD98_APOSI